MKEFSESSLGSFATYGSTSSNPTRQPNDLAPEVVVSQGRGLTVYTGISKKKCDSIHAYMTDKKPNTTLGLAEFHPEEKNAEVA